VTGAYDTIRYDMRCYFNVRSKADMSPLNLPHGVCVCNLPKVVSWKWNGRGSNPRPLESQVHRSNHLITRPHATWTQRCRTSQMVDPHIVLYTAVDARRNELHGQARRSGAAERRPSQVLSTMRQCDKLTTGCTASGQSNFT